MKRRVTDVAVASFSGVVRDETAQSGLVLTPDRAFAAIVPAMQMQPAGKSDRRGPAERKPPRRMPQRIGRDIQE